MCNKRYRRTWSGEICALLIGLVVLAGAAGCGQSNDESVATPGTLSETSPTPATTTTADPEVPAPDGSGIGPEDATTTTVDASQFWEPVPEGMNPADFSPDVVTREELTEFVDLPFPDPAAWDVDPDDVTRGYAVAVSTYVERVRSGLVRATTVFGDDNPRLLAANDDLLAGDEIAKAEWRMANYVVSEGDSDPDRADYTLDLVDVGLNDAGEVNCMALHGTLSDPEVDPTQFTSDFWLVNIRDGEPTPINPGAWRTHFVGQFDSPYEAMSACQWMS